MKNLKVIVPLLCMGIFLTTPMTAFASQPTSSTVETVTPYANIWYGVITANNVNLRTSNGTSIGQVNNGDTFTIDLSLDGLYFNGIYYRLVTMTSGQNKGISGWVSVDYMRITG